MQLTSSLSGAPVASPSSSKASGTDSGPSTQNLDSTTKPVLNLAVVVELSPEAARVLEREEPVDDGGSDPEAADGNPLAPAELRDAMSDVELFGTASESDLQGVFQLYVNPAEEIAEEAEDANNDKEKVVQANVSGSDTGDSSKPAPAQLSEDERAVVDKLKSRDSAVRAHEMAHVSAAGGLAGAPVYSYQTGPDGKRYAIGGSVSIDTSAESSPEDTIAKAQRIRSAALAPADPSAADRAVASRAARMESQARQAMARQASDESERTRVAASDAAVSAKVDLVEPGDNAAALPDLPKVDIDTSSVSSVIPGGISTLATSSRADLFSDQQSVLRHDSKPTLYSFAGGSAAVAQLYTPSERLLEAAFTQQFAS
jgi:hypothetical protein